MWNDTDYPLAYLITFRSYGTWLHGDERGSVSRFRNQYKSRRLPPEKNWLQVNRERMKGETVLLSAQQRHCVEEALKETCEFRHWILLACNVRTNHAHTVVSIGTKKTEIALTAVGRASRALGQTRVASDIFGMKQAWLVQSNTCSLSGR